MAQQNQWQQDPASQDDGAILRLDSALRRIAAAAGRRQDALRVAELTARAAQHEAELLLQAQGEQANRRREETEALLRVDEQASQREEEMRELAARLDGLIAMVRAAIPDWEPGQAISKLGSTGPGVPNLDAPGLGTPNLGTPNLGTQGLAPAGGG